MTLTEFLTLPQDKQELEVAKFVNPGPWKHDIDSIGHEHKGGHKKHCTKCGWYKQLPTTCKRPDRLTLDWNLAKRLQGEITLVTKANIFDDTLKVIWRADEEYYLYEYWRQWEVKPIHYIAAAMAAKNYFKEQSK